MDDFSDDELVKELLKRLEKKEKTYHDLMVMTKKLEALNDRLLESEKVKSHFLSNIRNEINNPLTSVLTMCDLIVSNDGMQDFETLKSEVSMIYKEAFNLNFQLRNIFAAAELEAGESHPNISMVDIVSLVKNTVGSFQHKALEKKNEIKLDLSDTIRDNPLFGTDPEKLERIVSNLLSNAIEYSYEGRPIELRVWREDRKLRISVADHGVGIDKKDQGIVFERFRQLDTGVTKSHGGHGLGLSITKAAIELLNGTLSVISQKGDGAVFNISIPEVRLRIDEVIFSDDANNFFFDSSSTERF